LIGVIDYGVGNVAAFLHALKDLGLEASAVSTVKGLRAADKLILPGVGHFDQAMSRLIASGLLPEIEAQVLGDLVPILGVCVGMQMLADSSDEGSLPGLGWIPGKVKAMESDVRFSELPIPHMGWNDAVLQSSECPLVFGAKAQLYFYHLHSFYFNAKNRKDVVATTFYGVEMDTVIARENIYGVQFHPEKSHDSGAQLLKSFSENC